jgi:nucleoporin NUP1
MKRMLAKRKMELEEEEKGEEVITKVERAKGKEEDEAMEEDKTEPLPSLPPKEVPTPSKDDWYSLASGPSASTGGSSLRVGRAKSSRNHIVRPTARSRAKFSAAFEEEGDEAMLDEEKEREKEELEAAAKKAPEFKIPEGFSFAKDVCRLGFLEALSAHSLFIGETNRARCY